jgi:hypothetical protein
MDKKIAIEHAPKHHEKTNEQEKTQEHVKFDEQKQSKHEQQNNVPVPHKPGA